VGAMMGHDGRNLCQSAAIPIVALPTTAAAIFLVPALALSALPAREARHWGIAPRRLPGGGFGISNRRDPSKITVLRLTFGRRRRGPNALQRATHATSVIAEVEARVANICRCKDRIELLASMLGIPRVAHCLSGGGLRPVLVEHSRSDLTPCVPQQLPLEVLKCAAMAEFPLSNSDRRRKFKLGVVIPPPQGH
jgi:hypothetical protein